MRKIIFLLLFPCFLLCQERKQYDRVLSLTEFVEELKDAAEKNVDYTIKNTKITKKSKSRIKPWDLARSIELVFLRLAHCLNF